MWLLLQKSEKISNIWLIILGFIASLSIGILLDYWLYGKLTLSSWNYFEWHIIKGSIDNITEPWWFYIYYSMVQLVPPITLFVPLIIAIFWVLFPRHPITWITIPFILFHHHFGHKEMRYLFPVIPFLPIMFAMSIEDLIKRFKYLNKNIFKYLCQSVIYLSLIHIWRCRRRG